MKDTVKLIYKELKFRLNESTTTLETQYEGNYQELKEQRFKVIKGYLKKPERVIEELELHRGHEKAWTDETNSDTRLFGIDHRFDFFKDFFLKDNNLLQIFKKYISKDTISSMVMANRVLPKENNKGSGGVWHRDDKDGRQLKFILYLTDVGTENGNFKYIKYTHTLGSKFKARKYMKTSFKDFLFEETQIDQLPDKYEVVDVTGTAGDLIVVDTIRLHRGSPIKKGKRLALTQYLWNTTRIPKETSVRMI